jgi:hypothetical protein
MPNPQDKLLEELSNLRKWGFVDPQDRLHRFDLLLTMARPVGQGSTDRELVKDLLERACGELGSVFGPSLLALLGVSQAAWGRDVKERRQLAYDVFCETKKVLGALQARYAPPAFTSFSSRIENEMLKDLATQLERICKTEIERQLKSRRLAQAG